MANRNRSIWPLYHGKIILDPSDQKLSVIKYNTRCPDAAFGGNRPQGQGSSSAYFGKEKWTECVEEMQKSLRNAENWRRRNCPGILEEHRFRSWRILCETVFREWEARGRGD